MVVVKTVGQWAEQVERGIAKIEAANGGQLPPTLIAADAVDHEAFASVIEAMVALEDHTGQIVGDDLIAAAGLVPVDQALGG
jgi:hypothetical protein